MNRFGEGNRVRIDIPDETDPDHDLHASHGVVSNVLDDDAGLETGDPRDGVLYRVRIKDGRAVDLRAWDIRPPFDDKG